MASNSNLARKVLIAMAFVVMNLFVAWVLFVSEYSLNWRIGVSLICYAAFFTILFGYFRFIDTGPKGHGG